MGTRGGRQEGSKVNESATQGGLFSTVTPRKVPDGIHRQLISLITTGRLKPGERLPSERAMALEMGVSRQSIREAIHRAKAEGLIEVRQGEGTFVISSLKGNLKPPLSILLEAQAEKVFEFLEMRKLIECWCAERASKTATAGDLKRMREILKRMTKVSPGEAGWERADLVFHSSVAAASHNVIAMHVMEGLKDSFQTYFRVKKFTTRTERKDELLAQHRDIFEAIQQRDAGRARDKMLEHLDYVEKMIAEDLSRAR
jgi:GntR family transcriptional regulator, transcriptional repressor for pyruvate dehydrogenase complex